jgi:hypothetical protein
MVTDAVPSIEGFRCRWESSRLAAGVSRRADLGEKAVKVDLVPAFSDLSVLPPGETHAGERDAPARGRNAKPVPCMRPLSREPHGRQIPFRQHSLQGDPNIGERLAELPMELLEGVRTADRIAAGTETVSDRVGGKQLVDHLGPPGIPDLVEPSADEGRVDC